MPTVIDIPTLAGMPGTVPDGNVVYAEDTQRHYMVFGGIAYVIPNYSDLALKISTSVLDTDGTLASNSDAKIASQKAIKTYVDAKNTVKFWDAGSWKNGTPNTGDIVVFTDNTTVSGGAGNATFYITSDHTSSGSALCSAILLNSVRGGTIDSGANYNPGQPSIVSNKTITVPYTKQGNTGVTVLGINVLQTITYPAAPNGTVITVFGIGISA